MWWLTEGGAKCEGEGEPAGELPAWVHYFFNDAYAYEADVVTKLKAKPENAKLLGRTEDGPWQSDRLG